MKVVYIFTWHPTPWEEAHYEVGKVVVVKHGTAIEATIITLDTSVSLTITNVC